jgi:TP901 family phage tail tape measure protein
MDAKLDELNKDFQTGKITAEQFKAGVQSVNTEVGKASGAFTKGVTDLKQYALGFVGIVAAAQAVGAVIGGAVNTVLEFDKALSSIRALGGEYATNIDAIAEAAKTAGINFGFTATESLSAVEALAKAGVSAADILGGALPGALTLAAAGQLDVATAAETASKAMVQFGLSGGDVEHIADLLAAGAASATGEVSDFAQALNQSGLVASQAGISIEETVGALTAFAAAGLVGSDAGTSFRTMLLRLQNPSKESADEMERLGISAFDLEGNFIGLDKLAGQLQTQLKGLTNEQRSAALAQIFGSDAVRAANVLYTQGAQGIQDYTNKVNQSGFASKVAEEQTNNLSGKLDKLKASYQSFILGIEDGNGALAKSFKIVIDAANGLLLLLTESNDLLGRGVGTGGGSALRNEASIDAFRERINLLLDASERLAQSENTDKIVARYRDIIRVSLDRADTLEKTLALEAKLTDVLKNTEKGTVKYAATQVQLGLVRRQAEAQQKAQVAETQKEAKATGDATIATDKNTDAKDKATKATKELTDAQKGLLDTQNAINADARENPLAVDTTGGLQDVGQPAEVIEWDAIADAWPERQRIMMEEQELMQEQLQAATALAGGLQALSDAVFANSERNLEQRLREGEISQAQFDKEKKRLDERKAAFKVFAIAETGIATYLAATKALAEVPFPANLIASAAIIANGVANLIRIQGFAQGGKVKQTDGPRYTQNPGDSVLISAAPGEVVMTREQQRRANMAAGFDVFRAARVPGFAAGGMVGNTRVRRVEAQGIIARPTPSDLNSTRNAFQQAPIFVRVSEINAVQGTVARITERASL